MLGDLRILDTFDYIYMPVLRDEVSVRKLEVFMKLISDMGYRTILDKIKAVSVPDWEAFSEEMIRFVWKIQNGDEGG